MPATKMTKPYSKVGRAKRTHIGANDGQEINLYKVDEVTNETFCHVTGRTLGIGEEFILVKLPGRSKAAPVCMRGMPWRVVSRG